MGERKEISEDTRNDEDRSLHLPSFFPDLLWQVDPKQEWSAIHRTARRYLLTSFNRPRLQRTCALLAQSLPYIGSFDEVKGSK